MKRFIVSVMIGLFATGIFYIPAQAQETVDENSFEYRLSICAKFEKFARTIMRCRQKGGSLTEMLKIVDKADMSDKGKDVCRIIILMAFEEPRYMTKEVQRRAEIQFGNRVSRECLSGYFDK